MKERREISSIRDLINILDNAEINAKTVLAVKDEVGYHDNNYPDSEGNTISLPAFIHNNIQSLKDELTKLRTEAKEMTIDYVKSQCDRTHIMIERQTLKDMASYCRDAYDSADSVEYDADECRSYAENISGSLDDAKSNITGIQDDLEQIATQDMPEEEEVKKAPAKKSGGSNE